MRLLLTFTLSIVFSLCYAQQEITQWFLNNNRIKIDPGGISTISPNGITASFNPYVSSTSVCDASGNLLFACDGNIVIDKNLNPMPGSISNPLSANGTNLLSAAFPGDANKHYIFYSKTQNGTWVLSYAVIDLSLNSGAGDVVSTGNLIDSGLSEGFTLAFVPGSAEFWIVAHRYATDSFFCRKVTAAGIGSAVVSRAGSNNTLSEYRFTDLKTSPDGKYIAGYTYTDYSGIFAYTIDFVEVFNFDAATGILTNKVRSIRHPGYFINEGTVEFSADSRLLYVGRSTVVYNLQPCGFGSGSVTQYNLCYTDSILFSAYSMVVASDLSACNLFHWGRIQMAANKKIYFPYSPTNILSSIEYPNRIGSSSTYNHTAYSLSQGTNIAAPTFNQDYMARAVKNNIVYKGGCFPNPVQFTITNDTITTVQWDFGDPGSGASNTSALAAPQHIFSAPGKYTVTAQLYGSSGQFIETVNELVEIKDPGLRLLHNYPTDTSFCSGGSLSISLNAVNAIFYWKQVNPDGVVYYPGVNDNLTINESGTYYVQMRQNDCDGCILNDSIHVTVLDKPVVRLGPDRTLCTGDSILLNTYDQSYEGANYIWNTGADTSAIWIHTGGTYWLQSEFNNNGCPVRDSIIITESPKPVFSFPADTTLCNNESLLLRPGITNSSYLWQDGSTADSLVVTQPGTYWVLVTNSNNCTHSDTIHVSYINAQAVYLGADTTICSGDILLLQSNVQNASYLWSDGSADSSITVKGPGSYWLQVNNGVCLVADTINVVYDQRPVFSLGNDTAVCSNSLLTLQPGISNATYIWQDGSTQNNFSVSQPGTYWVQVTDNNFCSSSDTIIVTHMPAPIINLGNDTTICDNATLQLDATIPGIEFYTWQDESNLPTYQVTQPGLYYVTVKGNNGCSTSDSIQVAMKPIPVFSLGNDTTLCQTTQLALQNDLSNAGYLWSTGDMVNSIVVSQPGIYWLEVTQNGCSKRDSINIQYKPVPVVDLGNDTTLCEGVIKELDATYPGATYLWQDHTTDPVLTVNQPGVYSVLVDLNGCIKKDTVLINYLYKPVFTLGTDTVICDGSQILLDPKLTNASYLWQDGSTSPTFIVTQPGVYSLSATNSCGTASDVINIIRGLCQLEMPNAFTPNHDGLNDVFRVKYPYFIKTFNMVIYNRWGEKVFTTTDPYKGWDGNYLGENQPSGNYIWTIFLIDLDGNKLTAKGNVILIR
jgi:gliding motility-associated-like protein